MSQNEPKITPGQLRAIECLLTSRTVTEAATAAKISRSTLTRWLQDDDFTAALRAAEAAAVESISRGMVALSTKALAALDDTLEPSQPAALRLRSAQAVLGNLLTLRQLSDFEERLLKLEGDDE